MSPRRPSHKLLPLPPGIELDDVSTQLLRWIRFTAARAAEGAESATKLLNLSSQCKLVIPTNTLKSAVRPNSLHPVWPTRRHKRQCTLNKDSSSLDMRAKDKEDMEHLQVRQMEPLQEEWIRWPTNSSK